MTAVLPIWEHCALWLYDYIYLKKYIKYMFKSSTKFWNILFPIWKYCPSYRCIILFGYSSSRCNTMLSFWCLLAFWRKICGRKNKETVNEEGCDVGCIYHFTMLLPLHWYVNHNEKCLIIWAFICSSLFQPWPPLCCTNKKKKSSKCWGLC